VRLYALVEAGDPEAIDVLLEQPRQRAEKSRFIACASVFVA